MEAVKKMRSRGKGQQAWFGKDDPVAHPLLLAMPYPADVPPVLLELQDYVGTAMDASQTQPARISAVRDLFKFVRSEGALYSDGCSLLTQILGLLARTFLSAQVEEMLVKLLLEVQDIHIVEKSEPGAVSCAVFLLRANEPVAMGRWIAEAVKSRWVFSVTRLERMDAGAISGLGSDECLACIRILFLHAQYGFDIPRGADSSPAARHYHATTGKSLWKALMQGVGSKSRQVIQDFDARYGEAAYNQITHRLGLETTDPVSVTVESDAVPSKNQQREVSAPHQQTPAGSWHTVVPEPFTPASNSDEREALKKYLVLREPLAVPLLPEAALIDEISARLVFEFPWAEDVITAMFRDMRARRLYGGLHLGFQPMLLLGPPGSGKTRLGRRVAEELAISFLPLGLAGMDDSRTFLGTSRGWSSGQPSPIIEFLARHRTPSALILLDEIEKATNGAANSVSPTTALLGLLEPENSSRWYDTYLQANCDLTRLMYIATANSIDGIPGPLLSRMSIHVINRPTHAQLMQAIKLAMDDIAKEWSLPPGVFPSISPSQLDGLLPQNVRQLKALVRGLLWDWADRHLGPQRLH